VDDERAGLGTLGGDPLGARRGAVWWADLPSPWGRRSVLLIARDTAYAVLSSFVVAPLTTRIRRIPTAVLLDPNGDPVPNACIVSLDHLQVIERDWLVDPIGRLSNERMIQVDLALHFALGIEACPPPSS
jgi:mRNA interferase MazF